jgi:hypothetical protein
VWPTGGFMRLSSLASIVVVPLFVTVLGSTAMAAPPAKRAAKRSSSSASSSAAPRVLPAPTLKAESLPALPAPAADKTAVLPTSIAMMPALNADGPVTGAMPIVNASVAGSSEPLSSPAGSSSPPAQDAPQRGKSRSGASSGFVLQFGPGLLAPVTPFYQGADIVLPGASLDIRTGYYFGHVGIVAGVRGSYGHTGGGCSGDSCNGYSLQIPVVVQLAQDRAHGFYGEIGAGLGSTFAVFNKRATVEVSTPVELKLGAGYRLDPASASMPGASTLDFKLGADLGAMTHADIDADDGKYKGSIADPQLHVVLAAQVLAHFSL